MGHDAKRYPLERILATAELASSLAPGAEPQLMKSMTDGDAAVRYWAAMGLLMRGRKAVEAAGAELRAALADPSPVVRVAAAQALGRFGSEEDLKQSLETLRSLAPADTSGAYVSLMAVSVIDNLGPKAAGLRDTLETMPVNDPSVPGRANGYVSRVLQHIFGDKPREKAPPPKPRRKKG